MITGAGSDCKFYAKFTHGDYIMNKVDENFVIRILGDPNWSWDGVLPYFKSYEDYEEGGDRKGNIFKLLCVDPIWFDCFAD